MSAAEPKQHLIAKLSEIMGLMQAIPKEGFNAAQKYKFVRETDVAERASALLAERHIFIQQSVSGWDMRELYRTASGSTMWLSNVMMEFTFIDAETGETLGPVMFPGHGADTGDKGIYKAMTGAEKYFLMKTFLISTGDDPEADERVDKAAAAAGAAAGPPKVKKGQQPGVERGGKSQVATAAQVNEVIRHVRRLSVPDAEAMIALIRTFVDIQPPTEAGAIREWLASMPSSTIAKVIEGLAELAAYEAVDETVDEVLEEAPPQDPSGEQDSLLLE